MTRRLPIAGFVGTDETHRVTTLELLFDLVFVFAITSVTGLMSHHLTAPGLLQGLVIAMLMWFGWCAYAWLGNQARADAGPLRVAMLFAMTAYFVVALAIPEAFDDGGGGLSGPLVFVTAYAVVRLAHLVVYYLAAGANDALRRTIRRTVLSTLPALALLAIGAFVDEHWRLGLWAAAVVVDYVGVFVTGASGWQITAPGHFAERHQLVVIIAIGESIVATGVGVQHAPLTWALLGGALLGVVVSIALWWTYFGVVAAVAERTLASLTGEARTRLGRDTFTYLHLPVVVGIVYLALGIKVVLIQVAESVDSEPAHFSGIALVALYGGAALYLVAMSAIRWRDLGAPNPQRIVAAAALVALALVAELAEVTGLLNLLLVAAVLVGLIGYESTRRRAALSPRRDSSAE